MTKNTNREHPIVKLLRLILSLLALAVLTYITLELFANSWCRAAFGTSIDENSSWELKACAKYYWDIDLENRDGW
ncbi:hypothetical protein [Vibrio sp. 399]|uniref:hypothetical protein n=1 Tax=Vibrio sp. 399 TaxID=3074605 RepID=UPI0029641C8E|nr:hypothetical protein [Vibrio sp. 399]